MPAARPSDAVSPRAAGFVLLVLGAVLLLLGINAVGFSAWSLGGRSGDESLWALVVGAALVILGGALAVRAKPTH
jgi:hypothetical protein